jgi:cytochrome c oxidase subunit II
VVNTRAEHDGLMSLYLPIAAGVVIAVMLLVVVFALRWRHRPGREISLTANNTKLEGLYVLVLLGVVVLLLTRTFPTEARVDRVSSHPAVRVRVIAARWHWIFEYPALGIRRAGGSGPIPLLTVPANRTIRFSMTSSDVIHAFWIPGRRFKRDAMPGAYTTFDLTFPKPGFFPDGGACSEFCGLRHDEMRFEVRVLSPQAFARWAAANRTAA